MSDVASEGVRDDVSEQCDALGNLEKFVASRIAEIEEDFRYVTDAATKPVDALFVCSKYAGEIRNGLIFGILDPVVARRLSQEVKNKLQREQDRAERQWLHHFQENFRVDVPAFQQDVAYRLEEITFREHLAAAEDVGGDTLGDCALDGIISVSRAVRNAWKKLFGGRK
jgi:hypothetical protein